MSNEEDNDLYDEVFDYREDKVDPEVIKNLKQEIDQLQLEKNDLSKQIAQLSNVNSAVLKENKTLKTNITSLFKTAQNEIERKNRMIDQLRLDSAGKSKPSDNGNSSSLQQKQNNTENTSNSTSQHRHNIEPHRHDRYARDRYGDRYNDSRQDRYQSPSKYSDSRSNRSSKYSSNSSRQRDWRSSNTRVRNGTESSNLDQNTKHKEIKTKISEDRRQSNSEKLDTKTCNTLTNLNVSTIKQNLSPPKSSVSSQMKPQNPPISKTCNLLTNHNVSTTKQNLSPPKSPVSLQMKPQNPPISKQINLPNTPISPHINISNLPISSHIKLPNPSIPKKIDLKNTPVSPQTNLPKPKVSPQNWLSKHLPLKKCLPKPPVKVVANGPRTLFNRRIEVKINRESKVLYQQALAKFNTETSTSPPEITSNSKLTPIQTSPTQKMSNSDKEAVPSQISPTPCISLIDKIKQIEQSVSLKKIEGPKVSEGLPTPIPSVKCDKNMAVKKTSPPVQERKEPLICNKINENLTPSANIFLQKGPQNKKNGVCENSKAPQQSQLPSIFEPEIQIHCESSCESNFSELFVCSTKTTKGKAGVNNNVNPKNSKVRAKKGTLSEQTPPLSKNKSRPTEKSQNPSISPKKLPLAPVDFIPVYNLKSPKKQRELSLANVTNKSKSGGTRPCLKLGEVSIKVSTPGKSPHKPVKQSPHKASITKVLRVDNVSSSEVDQCKSQNNQNEANRLSLQSTSPAEIDEDSQDIVVTNRKRKFVIYDSDEEISLPSAKKPTSRKVNKQKQLAPEKETCNQVKDISADNMRNVNVKSSEMETLEGKISTENIPTAAIDKSEISLKNVETSTVLGNSILELALTSKPATSIVHQKFKSNPETYVKCVADVTVPLESENNQLICPTQLTPMDLSESKQTLEAPPSDQNQLKISAEVVNTTLESSVCSENDVSQKTDIGINISINSNEANNSLTKSRQFSLLKTRKENRFSSLSRRRPAKLVRAVVKKITITSPEKVETIHVGNNYDEAPNRTSLEHKLDPPALRIEDEQNCTNNSLIPRTESVPVNSDGVICVEKTLSILSSILQGSKSNDTTCFEAVPCVTPEVPSLHQDIAKNMNILNENKSCIVKATGNETCTSLVNTLPSECSGSQECLKSEDHIVSSPALVDVDMTTPGRKRTTSHGKIDIQEKSLEQTSKQSFEPVLQNEESTLDANDLVGRVLRDCKKPIINLNVSITSEPPDDNENEDISANVNTEIERKTSTPKNMKYCKESFDSKKEELVRIPVRKVGKNMQVQSPRKFEELETISDSKWKATNASLKNESFNYSGRKPKKRVSLYFKPSTCKSPGKPSPGNKALKTKSPLKKELAQAITTSYKVSSFRDIISTQPIQKNEKINVLTPRKSPNQANVLRKINDINKSNNQTASSGTNVKVHETRPKPRESCPKQKQSFLQHDIKMKLKAINSDEKTQNQIHQSSNTNVHTKTSSVFAAAQKNINQPVTSHKSELHDQVKPNTNPQFLIPEVLEDNARFFSISTKTSTITATTSTSTLPSDQMIKTTVYSQSKRCTSFESNSSSSLSFFNSMHSDIQFRNEHTISPFQDAYKLMNETPFKQFMTGTFNCVSPMAETPYKVEQTPRKITPETSQDKLDHVEDINILYPDLKTPLKPINTSSCSSTDIHNLQDELALTPDGSSKISGCSSDNPNEINDLRCHVESMDRDIATRPTQHKGILPISSNQSSAKVSKPLDSDTVFVQTLSLTEKHTSIKTNPLDSKQLCTNVNYLESDLPLEEKSTAKQNPDNTKKQECVPSQLIDKETHSNLKKNKITGSSVAENPDTIIVPRTENQTINNNVKESSSDNISPHIKVKSVLSQSSSKDQNSFKNWTGKPIQDSYKDLNESSNRHTQLTSPKKIRFIDHNKQHGDNRINDENQCKSINNKPYHTGSTRHDRSPNCRQRKRRRTPSPRCSDKRYREQNPSSDKIYKNRYSSPIERSKLESNERQKYVSPERRPRHPSSNGRQKNTSSESKQSDTSVEVRTRNPSSDKKQLVLCTTKGQTNPSPSTSRKDVSPDLRHKNPSPNRNRGETSPIRMQTNPSPNSSRRDRSLADPSHDASRRDRSLRDTSPNENRRDPSPNRSKRERSPHRIQTDPSPHTSRSDPSPNSSRRDRSLTDPSFNTSKNDPSPNRNRRGSSPDVRQRKSSPSRSQKDSSPRRSRRYPSPHRRERYKHETWRNERNRNRTSSTNEKSRERDKPRRRGDRDLSIERSRNYRPSPERSRYRDRSRGRPRDYRARSPERSARPQENPKQIRETPVKKVIVKEILYYTETRSDSEEDRDRYGRSQKRHSPSPVRKHRNETNRPRLNNTYDSQPRRTSDSESVNPSWNESNGRNRDNESNPKHSDKNDNLHRQDSNTRPRQENIAGSTETKTSSSNHSIASKDNSEDSKTSEANTTKTSSNNSKHDPSPIKDSSTNHSQSAISQSIAGPCSSNGKDPASLDPSNDLACSEEEGLCSSSSNDSFQANR